MWAMYENSNSAYKNMRRENGVVGESLCFLPEVFVPYVTIFSINLTYHCLTLWRLTVAFFQSLICQICRLSS